MGWLSTRRVEWIQEPRAGGVRLPPYLFFLSGFSPCFFIVWANQLAGCMTWTGGLFLVGFLLPFFYFPFSFHLLLLLFPSIPGPAQQRTQHGGPQVLRYPAQPALSFGQGRLGIRFTSDSKGVRCAFFSEAFFFPFSLAFILVCLDCHLDESSAARYFFANKAGDNEDRSGLPGGMGY